MQEKAKRRDPRRFAYTGAACPDYRKVCAITYAQPDASCPESWLLITLSLQNRTCRRGAACPFAHGVFESWLHPSRYRTQVGADRLLESSGWRRSADGLRRKHDVPLTLTYVQFPESQTGVRVATLIQSELLARGISVTIKSVTNAQLFLPASQGGQLASGAFDLAYVPFAMGADPDDAFLLRCDGPSNYMRWCDHDVDGWEREALAITDHAARRKLYARIEARVARDVPLLFLFDPSYLYAYDRRLHGFAPNPFSPTWNSAAWSGR